MVTANQFIQENKMTVTMSSEKLAREIVFMAESIIEVIDEDTMINGLKKTNKIVLNMVFNMTKTLIKRNNELEGALKKKGSKLSAFLAKKHDDSIEESETSKTNLAQLEKKDENKPSTSQQSETKEEEIKDEIKVCTPERARREETKQYNKEHTNHTIDFEENEYEEDDYTTRFTWDKRENKFTRTPVSTEIIDDMYDYVKSNKKIFSGKKLSSSTPVYNGKTDEDLEEWMFVIEQSLMTANITDEVEKLAAITTFVRGTPLSLLRNYIRNNRKPTLKEYFELLDNLIPQASRTQYLKNKLMDMKQGHDFEEFFNEFQKMVITIQSRDSNWKESDSVFAFTRALRAKVKFEVEKVEATTLICNSIKIRGKRKEN